MKLKASLMAIMMMAVVLGLVGSGTFAVFTDTEANGGNTFGTGNVDLSLNPSTALFTVSGIKPGDYLPLRPITVTNSGSMQLRMAMESTASNPDGKNLRNWLTLKVRHNYPVASCTGYSGGWEDYGLALYLEGPIGNEPPIKIFGDKAQGNQGGDIVMPPGYTDVFCFGVNLTAYVTNTVASASTTVTFTFYAEQTDNN
ncbi:MAG: hypothetical protein HY675_21990 [Chloroflexi bacterium]|nr:hypothetical protein [Chloroflexota bacterium]